MRTWLIPVCSLYVWFPEFPTNRQKILHPMLKFCRSQGSYPASRVAVKSYVLLTYAAFSQIPYHIFVKSWIPRP